MNTYVAIGKGGQRTEVQATTTYEAQKKAAAILKAKKTYDVTVILAAKADGTPVVHVAVD